MGSALLPEALASRRREERGGVSAGSFFLALAVMGLSVAAILAWEIHTSRPRDTPKAAGLRAANRGGKGEGP
jgi:hypothetical protein